jgi:hypothetical protein
MDILLKRVLADQAWHGICIIYLQRSGSRGKTL